MASPVTRAGAVPCGAAPGWPWPPARLRTEGSRRHRADFAAAQPVWGLVGGPFFLSAPLFLLLPATSSARATEPSLAQVRMHTTESGLENAAEIQQANSSGLPNPTALSAPVVAQYPGGGSGRAGSSPRRAGGSIPPCSAHSGGPRCCPGSRGSGTRSLSPSVGASQRCTVWTSRCSRRLGRRKEEVRGKGTGCEARP